MTHEGFEELVSAYIDSELTPEEEKAILEHMEGCANCRNLYEQEKIIKEKLYGLNEIIPVPSDLNENTLRSLEDIKGRGLIPNLFLGVAASLYHFSRLIVH